MENTPKETPDEPVLLRWEMPVGRRWLYRLTPPIATAVLFFAYWAISTQLSPRMHAWFFWVVFLPLLCGHQWLMYPLWFASARIDCTATDLRTATVFGHRFRMQWAGIRVLRRGMYGFAVIPQGWRAAIYLPVPPHVLDKLIAILREASNARIIGFDSETT